MPWVTKLPFPVHTLSKVTTYDHISGTKLVSRYAYHHGYYDRHEREFRGFGRVEQWDTELFNLPAGKGFFPIGTNEEGIYKTAPIHTKTWFHNGYFEEASDLLQAFKKEYYQGDAEAWILPENILPETPHAGEWRDAHRALKGQVLRTEVYGEGNIPYSVSESNYEVKLVQPQKG